MTRVRRLLLLALAATVTPLPARGPAHGDDVVKAIVPATRPPMKEGAVRPGELIVQFRAGADETTADRALREVRLVMKGGKLVSEPQVP